MSCTTPLDSKWSVLALFAAAVFIWSNRGIIKLRRTVFRSHFC